jgi:DNA-binding transcriptional LysR family regulator
VGFGLYAAQRYLDSAEPIRSLDDLRNHAFIGLYGADGRPQLSLGDYDGVDFPVRMVVVTNSPSAQISAAGAGYGIAVLSHRWVSMRGDLVPVLPDVTVQEADMWLVTHEELRHSARIRAVSNYLSERVLASKEQFRGC